MKDMHTSVMFASTGHTKNVEKKIGEVLIDIKSLSKAYPGVQALDCVDLKIRRGEIHALLGQNGAGKSTLIRMLSGAELPDSGVIEINGRPLHLKTPMDAQRSGIFTIFQELSLVPELSVAENIFISDLPKNKLGMVDWGIVKDRASEIMNWLGFPLDVDQSVKNLSVAQKQGVELAKALHHKAEVVLLDEPSAALPQPDVKRLFEILIALKNAGLAIVYISHRLEEVQELCGVATVLRDGKKVHTFSMDDTNSSDLVRAMVGRNVNSSLLGEALAGVGRPRIGNGTAGEVVMSVDCISDGKFLDNISFDLHSGEVIGITGLLGNGQPELAGCLFGNRSLASGSIKIFDKKIKKSTPRSVINAGVGLLPEERKTQGLVLGMTIEHNMTLASQRQFSKGSIIDNKKEKSIARDALEMVCEEFPKYRNTRYGRGPIGGIFQASTTTVSSNTPFGFYVGATPDGRGAKTPLSDGQSPFRGTDTLGPTAAVSSVSKLNLKLLSEGSLYNLKMSPSDLRD